MKTRARLTGLLYIIIITMYSFVSSENQVLKAELKRTEEARAKYDSLFIVHRDTVKRMDAVIDYFQPMMDSYGVDLRTYEIPKNETTKE